MDDLTIHIGLHRTGTTYLQYRVYPRLSGVTYIWNKQLESWTSRIIWEPGASWNAGERRADVMALASGPVLIFREGLSGSVFNFRATQERTAERLAELFPAARIPITIRRQDTYIG